MKSLKKPKTLSDITRGRLIFHLFICFPIRIRNKKYINEPKRRPQIYCQDFGAKDYFLIFIWYFLTPTGRRKDERKMEFDIFLLTNTHSHIHSHSAGNVGRSVVGRQVVLNRGGVNKIVILLAKMFSFSICCCWKDLLFMNMENKSNKEF